AASSNYQIHLVGGVLFVLPATLTVPASPEIKTYGSPDPVLSYSVQGLQFNDTASVLTGSLTRDAGEIANFAAKIRQGNLVSTTNDYTIQFVMNFLQITRATLTVTANPQTKVYGSTDPVFSYQVSGLQFTD